jgi:hypothetical protein
MTGGRLRRALAATGIVAVSVATPLGGAVGRLVGSSTACAGASGSIHVAVVVDYDGLPGAPTSPRVDCIAVPPGTRSSALLTLRARQLGLPAPRWRTTDGLLCAIDGYPSTGCATTDANGTYTYWSYWWGVGSSWQYASLGPTGHVATDGSVEGWRFGNGRGTGQDDAPRASVSASRCPVAPAPTAVPPASSGGGVITASPSNPAGTAPAGTKQPSARATAPNPAAAPNATTTSFVGPAPASAGATSTTSTNPIVSTTTPVKVEGASEQRAGSVTIRPHDGGTSGWIPTLAGVGAVALAVAGVVIVRHRRLSLGQGSGPA